MGQTRYPSKRWVFKRHFSVKVKQHGQQQLYLQYRVCWILYKMIGAPSFPQPYLWIQSSLQSRPKSVPLLHSIFILLFLSYFLTKSSLQSTLALLPLCLNNISPPYFCVQPSQQSIPKICSLLQPFSKFWFHQRTKELWILVRNDFVLMSPFFLKV